MAQSEHAPKPSPPSPKGRPPEGRLRLVENGVVTPGDQRDATDGLCVVEIDGEIVCHIPTTSVRWEVDYQERTPKLTITMLAGKSEIASRELTS